MTDLTGDERPIQPHEARLGALCERLGLGKPDPDEDWSDITAHESETEMTLYPSYSEHLSDDDEGIAVLTTLLMRQLSFVYYGGLEAQIPDALTNGKTLAIRLLTRDDDLPPETRQLLEDYTTLYKEREISFIVLQLPAPAWKADDRRAAAQAAERRSEPRERGRWWQRRRP